jgi:hypothetical protein
MPRFLRPPKKILQRQLELRARLWPDLNPADLWSRHTHDGFTTVPSSIPLIMSIMDDLSKGRPVSSTYLELWTRAYDEGFVTLSKPREMAFHAGFSTQRAERTWKQKLHILDELGFIALKSGPSGPASYALLLNPYRVIKRHYEEKTPGLREDKYNALVARAAEIGDASFNPEQPAFAAPPVGWGTPQIPGVVVTGFPAPPNPFPASGSSQVPATSFPSGNALMPGTVAPQPPWATGAAKKEQA